MSVMQCTAMCVGGAVVTGDGYVHVATIPAGATYIELRENSNNYIGTHLSSSLI